MLNAYVKKSGNVAHVVLRGGIDETSGRILLELLPKLAKADVTFDVAAISAINSIGFHQWVQFLRTLSGDATFRFVRCGTTFLEYASLLKKLSYASQIESIIVPFVCGSCGKEEGVDFEVDAIEPGEELEDRICRHCNGTSQQQSALADLLAFRDQA